MVWFMRFIDLGKKLFLSLASRRGESEHLVAGVLSFTADDGGSAVVVRTIDLQ